MATFSTNQSRQLYVATQVKDPNSATLNEVGAIKFKNDAAHEYIWAEYMGAGGITASDKIKVSNIVSAKATKGEKMRTPLNRYKVVLNGDVSAGQDYMLRIVFDHFIGMTEEHQYLKYGLVHGTSSMNADAFYKTLAISIAKNMSRELNDLCKVYAHSTAATQGKFDSEGLVEVKDNFTVDGGTAGRTNNWDDGSKTVTDIDYILLEEVGQPYIKGKMKAEKIPFKIYPGTIINSDSDEVIWGTVTEEKSVNYIKSSYAIADLEYFCMGERGDQYRGIGYPNNIETQYLVDTSKEYDTLDIQYYYAGNAEDIQKSPRTLTIVADNATTNKLIKAIIADVNTATSNKPSAITNP